MPSHPQVTLGVAGLKNPSFVSFLDLTRWLAAGMVVVGHLRNPLFLGYGDLDPAARNLAVKAWYFVTGLHAEAVVVFFVLSGFLVGSVGVERSARRAFAPTDYAIDRITRLFIPFWPALLLTLVLDRIGITWLGSVGFWDQSHPMIAQKVNALPFEQLGSVQDLIANALMLQTFFVAPFGSNQPLWTISAEFWFYVVFGLVMAARMVTGKNRALWVVSAILLTLLLGLKFVLLAGLWVLGLIAGLSPRWIERPVLAAALFVVLLAAVRAFQSVSDSDAVLRGTKDYVVALGFAWLLASMRRVDLGWLKRSASANRFMADFSYSLYLIHFPVMLFVLALLYATGQFPGIATGYQANSLQGVGVYVAAIGIIYLSAFAFSLVTERRTAGFRRHLKIRLAGGPEQAERLT